MLLIYTLNEKRRVIPPLKKFYLRLLFLHFHDLLDQLRFYLVLDVPFEGSCSVLRFIDLLDDLFDLFVGIFRQSDI